LRVSQDFLDDRWSNEKRVVRTEKDKKWNIFKDFTNKINNGLNNQDFEKVWNVLQDLLREIEKSAKLIEKEGYPSFFLRCLKRVHDEITEFNKNAEARKKMKKHSSIAFNTMNQKMKKIYPDYEEQINQLLEKGEEEEEESEIEEESSSESSSDEDDITLLESPDPMVRRRYWLKKKVKKD
jgi:translation initiation factor 3 subunit C